jgi:hypothetical protein
MQVPPSGPGNSWLPRSSFQSSMRWKSAVVPARDDSTFNRRVRSNIAAGSSRLLPIRQIKSGKVTSAEVLATGLGEYPASQRPSHGIKLN